MSIKHLDPKGIKEIVETDTVKTAVMTREAAIEMGAQFKGQGETIHIEGMEMQLLRFHKLQKKDGSLKGALYVKINPDLGQILYATSDDKDADKVLMEIMPALQNMSNKTGLQLVNIRTVATESLGSLKRNKGVTTTPALMKVLDQEQETDHQGGK